jgi:hypothetical protein
MILLRYIGLILLFSFPVGIVFFTIWRERTAESRRSLLPFEELRRRPAGESARVKVEEFGEEIDAWLMMLVITPFFLAIALSFRPDIRLVGIAAFFLAATIMAAIAYRKLRSLSNNFRKYRLGFQGERYVAEELNLLMLDRYHVFHDVPFEKFNIDHVVVGPSGVFAVETKAKRKKIQHGDERHIVVFTGKRLEFPGGWNIAWLDQARLNAKTLSQWLRSASGEPVSAKPILTIPGWWIEPKGSADDIHVLNPKQIRGLIRSLPQDALNSGQIQRITHQLEEKCKLEVE